MTSVLPDFAELTHEYSAHNYAPLPVDPAGPVEVLRLIEQARSLA